jgi:hypothetical protein
VSTPTPLPTDALTAWTLLRRPWPPHVPALTAAHGKAQQGCLLRTGGAPAVAAAQPQPDVTWTIIGVSHR